MSSGASRHRTARREGTAPRDAARRGASAPEPDAKRRNVRDASYFVSLGASLAGALSWCLPVLLLPLTVDLTAPHALTAPSLTPWPNLTAPSLTPWPNATAPSLISCPGSPPDVVSAPAAAVKMVQTSTARAAVLAMVRMLPLFLAPGGQGDAVSERPSLALNIAP